jgi:hypothetical protein
MYVPRYPHQRIREIHEAPEEAEWESMWCFAMSPLCAWAASARWILMRSECRPCTAL